MKRTSDSLLDDDVDDVEEEGDEKEGERKSQSAFGVLLEESVRPRLVTFVPELDHLLGGGIPTSCITELCLLFFFFLHLFISFFNGWFPTTNRWSPRNRQDTALSSTLCKQSHAICSWWTWRWCSFHWFVLFSTWSHTHMETSQRAYDAQTQKDHFHGQGMKKWWKQQFHTHRRVHQRCC